jgi:hypothetical protein
MPNGRYAIGELVIATPSRRVCGGKCRLGGRVTPPGRCAHLAAIGRKMLVGISDMKRTRPRRKGWYVRYSINQLIFWEYLVGAVGLEPTTR